MYKLLLLGLFSANVFATPVNINRADAQTISKSLTGISLKKAEAIVANRVQDGDFKSVDDLKRVIGIGEKTLVVNKADILLSDIKTNVSHGKSKTGRHHPRTRQRHGHISDRHKQQN